MKKILVLGVLLSLLTACGNDSDFAYHSKKEKEQFIEKMVKNDSKEMWDEYCKILDDLKEKYKSGNSKAKEEYEEWDEAMDNVTNGGGYVNVERDFNAMDYLRGDI